MPKFICSPEIEKRYLEKFRYIVEDYEASKERKHTRYKTCQQLFEAHRMDRRIFNKYYHRFLESGRDFPHLCLVKEALVFKLIPLSKR